MTRTQNDSAAGYGAERNGISPADLGERATAEFCKHLRSKGSYTSSVAADAIEDLSRRLRAAEGALEALRARQ